MENNHVKTIVVVVVSVGLILAAYIYFFLEREKAPSLQEMRAKIIGQSVLKFDIPTGFVNLKREDLPKDLQIFIPESPRRVSILKLEDGSQKPSYKILLEIDENMHKYYFDLRQELVNKSWSEILSKRSDLVSIAEYQNNLYEMRVETVLVTDKSLTARNLESISSESKETSVTILIKSK